MQELAREWSLLGPSDALAVLLSYLLGAVPFGLLLARALKGVDLRQIGSGNIGATNAMRVLGRPLGILVFFLDAGKGAAALWVFARLLGSGSEPTTLLRVACGAAAVTGHCWSVWLRFHGGKGVATGCGALAAIDPVIFLVGGAVWLGVLAAFRMVALASIAMGLAFPLVAWWRAGDRPAVVAGALLLAVLILVRHRSNMARMLAGTEPRVFRGERADGETRA